MLDGEEGSASCSRRLEKIPARCCSGGQLVVHANDYFGVRGLVEVGQKEGNGVVHMGFALSDIAPEGIYIRKILHHTSGPADDRPARSRGHRQWQKTHD